MTTRRCRSTTCRTGKLLRSWDALKHIPLGESHATVPTNGFPWDAYHVNAIDLAGNGTFLVSMRNTWAAYLVNIEDRPDRVDARRQALELQVRPRRGIPVAARRAPGPGLDGEHVRRPLLSADRRRHLRAGDRALARARAEGRPAARARRRSRRSTPAKAASKPNTWASTQPLTNSNVLVGWGSGPVVLGVQPLGQAAAGRRIPPARPHLPRDAGAVGGAAADRARGRRAPARAAGRPFSRAGTGRPGCASWRVLAGAGRLAGPPSPRTPSRASRATIAAVSGSYTTFKVRGAST